MAVDNATVNLYVNNEQAKGAIAELEKSYQALKKARKDADASGDINKSLQLQAQERTALEKLKEAKRGVLDIEKAMANLSVLNIRQLTAIRGKLKRELLDLNQGTKEYIEKQKQLARVEKQLSSTQRKRTNGQMGFFKNILAAGIFTKLARGLKSLFSAAINTRKEFEKYEAVLKNTLQSEVLMRQSMEMLKDFAIKTPFQLDELVDGYSKLVNQGFKPSKEELTKLGDLASYTAKSFEQVTEALLSAQTGQFRQLKEFGILSSVNGDKVKFSFRGVTTEVHNSSEAIRNYIVGLGDLTGVTNSMAVISETTEGKISNMGDAWDSFLNTLGSRSGGIISFVLDRLTDFIETIERLSMSIDQIKAKVADEQNSKNFEYGLEEIDGYKKRAMARGRSEKEASDYAMNLYRKSRQEAINNAENELKFALGSNKTRLENRVKSLKAELELVDDHYNTLENKRKQMHSDEGGGGKSQSWSLENDAAFTSAKLNLRKQLLDNEITTEEEYNEKLLTLEITTLQARLDADKESGNERIKLQQNIYDKQYTQQKKEQDRLKKLIEVADGGKSEADREQIAFEKRLKELGLFNKKREDLTAEELGALLVLEKNHTSKLSSIRTDELVKEAAHAQEIIDRKLSNLKEESKEALRIADTLEKKKVLLLKFYSAEQLKAVRSDKQAADMLTKAYANEEQQALSEHLKEMLKKYQEIAAEITRTGLFDGVAFTDEDKGKLQDIIDNLRKQLSDLTGESPEKETKSRSVDILGMSMDDWNILFANIENGKLSLEQVLSVANAIGNAFGEVNNLLNAINQRDLKQYEKSQDRKKRDLDRRLQASIISQDAYNAHIQLIDEETDKKRQEIERKQAERAKMLAIFQAIINTATAVTAALGSVPFGPWNIALAAIVGVLGGVQIGTILAQPIGFEEGGLIDVARAQDGKRFNAKYSPNQRGAINSPTILVGENGAEYVVPSEGYENPTIRPVLDIIEQARRNNTLGQINLPQVVTSSRHSYPGRESGGFVDQSYARSAGANKAASSNHDDKVLAELLVCLNSLNKTLSKPIKAEAVINGKHGTARQLEKYNNIINEANL